MKYLKTFNEKTDYYTLHDGDEYQITKTERDDNHDYKYCDGILYELSGNDLVVDISEVENTPENTFYPDQIDRYIEYFEDGGITQTFSVNSSPLGGCSNLEEMLDYLDEGDNFDLTYNLLSKYYVKLFDIFMKDGLWQISSSPEDFGFSISDLSLIRNEHDLHKYYNDEKAEDFDEDFDSDEYDEELLNGFVAILDNWKDSEEYTLTDFNHRFEALKEMGKKQIMVEIIR